MRFAGHVGRRSSALGEMMSLGAVFDDPNCIVQLESTTNDMPVYIVADGVLSQPTVTVT